MFRYSIKRFLLGIPVIWLLITIVFLSSRLLPGTYGAESIQFGGSSTFQKSDQKQRDEVYRSYLIKTGQDLPVFYFSILSAATPIASTTATGNPGYLLRQLSWRFGAPEKAETYNTKLQDLTLLLKAEGNQEQLPILYRLQHTLHPDSITILTRQLAALLPEGHSQVKAKELNRSAMDLTIAANKFAFLLPAFRWHGTQNQYHQWLLQLTQGNLGTSFRDERSVTTILWEAVSTTFWLTISSMLVAFILALELSIIMVRKASLNWHKFLLPILYVLDSIPLFVLSLILLVLLATPDFIPMFPVFGLGYYFADQGVWYDQLLQTIPYLVLPVICLVLANLPYLTNQIYRSLSDTMQADYIKTAYSKGLKEGVIVRKHALRNALLPVITVLSDFLPALVAGSVVIETIFAIPGIGRLLFTSVLARDFPVILGIVLMVAIIKMLSHLVADICYAKADPRVHKMAAL